MVHSPCELSPTSDGNRTRTFSAIPWIRGCAVPVTLRRVATQFNAEETGVEPVRPFGQAAFEATAAAIYRLALPYVPCGVFKISSIEWTKQQSPGSGPGLSFGGVVAYASLDSPKIRVPEVPFCFARFDVMSAMVQTVCTDVKPFLKFLRDTSLVGLERLELSLSAP